MARKPRDYAKEYARRIARAMAKGKTRQQARGHRAQEHIERREREREEEGGLTRSQVKSVFSWAERRQFEIHDATVESTEVVDWARENGFEAFTAYRRRWEQIRRNYKREQAMGTYASRGIAWLESEAAGLSIYDISWLYYH